MFKLVLFSICAFLFAPPAALGDPTFALGQQVLEKESRKMSLQSKPLTLADALGALKEVDDFKPLFKHYTLVKESQSLQEAKPLSPRALLYGNTGRLILSFNDNPSFDGGYSLESAEFDESSHMILFREVIFKDEIPTGLRAKLGGPMLKSANETVLDGELSLKRDDIEFENDKLAVTRPNPPKCLQCHSLSATDKRYARYIWNSYAHWPGIYGENDDKLSQTERALLVNFKFRAVKHNRYHYLDALKPFTSLYPYGRGRSHSGPLFERANLLLTEYISYRQAEEIAALTALDLTATQKASFIEHFRCRFRHDSADSAALKGAFNRLGLNYLETVLSMDRSSLTGDRGVFISGGYSLFLSYDINSLVLQELYRILIANDQEASADLAQSIQSNQSSATPYYDLSRLTQETVEYLRARINLMGYSFEELTCPQRSNNEFQMDDEREPGIGSASRSR